MFWIWNTEDEDIKDISFHYAFMARSDALVTSAIEPNWTVPVVNDIHSIAGIDG